MNFCPLAVWNCKPATWNPVPGRWGVFQTGCCKILHHLVLLKHPSLIVRLPSVTVCTCSPLTRQRRSRLGGESSHAGVGPAAPGCSFFWSSELQTELGDKTCSKLYLWWGGEALCWSTHGGRFGGSVKQCGWTGSYLSVTGWSGWLWQTSGS